MLEKYGCENPMQCKSIQEKAIQTNLVRYGVKNVFENSEIKEKLKKTNMDRYGFENPFENPEIKEKCRQTSLRNHGVEHPMQCAAISEKSLKSAYKLKTFIFPSGNVIKTQGYENFALQDLLCVHNVSENDIITDRKKVPEIWYVDENDKKRRHFVDIYIASQNKCIEVKSRWTVNIEKDHVFPKQIAAKALGYIYEIWVYNNEKLDVIYK
jgi:hypothetical protein